jgi:methionyl-tRNA formyltransferase
VSYAPKVDVDDARVDWTHPAVAIDRQVRACTPAPGAWTTYAGERLKLGPVAVVDAVLPPGELAVAKHEVLVGTGTSAVRLGDVRPHGRKQMPAADWARGVRVVSGSTLGSTLGDGGDG